MGDTKQSKTEQSQRSADFRYIPCDAINIGISDNGLKLLLGVTEMDGTVLEFVGVHITHKTTVILRDALSKALEDYQLETGQVIEVPASTHD